MTSQTRIFFERIPTDIAPKKYIISIQCITGNNENHPICGDKK